MNQTRAATSPAQYASIPSSQTLFQRELGPSSRQPPRRFFRAAHLAFPQTFLAPPVRRSQGQVGEERGERKRVERRRSEKFTEKKTEGRGARDYEVVAWKIRKYWPCEPFLLIQPELPTACNWDGSLSLPLCLSLPLFLSLSLTF